MDNVIDQINREWGEVKQKAADLLKRFPDADKLGEHEEMFAKFDERFNQMEAKLSRARTSEAKEGEMPAEAKAHAEDHAAYLQGRKSRSTQAEKYMPEAGKGVAVIPRYEVKDGKNVLRFEYQVVAADSPEYKALSVDSDPAGGFLVSPTMSQNVIQRVFDTSPVRQYASVITISGDAWEEPADDDEADAGWVGERATRAATDNPVLDKLRIPLHEIYAKPQATQKSLDLIGSRVEDWLNGKVADKIARTEATAFVSGNGSLKPRGLTQYVAASDAWNQIKYVVSGAAAALTFDGFISVRGDLQPQYLRSANWFTSRATRAAARKLKDAEGQYLWQPNNQLGDPDTLGGHPVVIFEDMPAVSANTYPVLFGDLREGYYVVDHTSGIRVLRDPYSAKPYVEFYTTKYVGGGLRQGRALRFMKIAAS
jgi:HK97 family phage major capsid protein